MAKRRVDEVIVFIPSKDAPRQTWERADAYRMVMYFSKEAEKAARLAKKGDCNLAQQYLDSAHFAMNKVDRVGDVSPRTFRKMESIVRSIQKEIDRCDLKGRGLSGTKRRKHRRR